MSALLLMLFAAAGDPAGPLTAVMVTPWDSAAEERATALDAKLAAALRARGVALTESAKQFAETADPGTEGQTLFDEGKQAYDNLDLDAAIEKLAAAASFYGAHAAAATHQSLAELYLFLGAARLQNGVKDGSNDLVAALALNPALSADPKLFDSSVQKAFAAARKHAGNQPKGKVLVSSSPTGSAVELNGKSVGLTPVVEAAAGKTLVRVTRPGFSPFAVLLDATPKAVSDVKAPLLPTSQFAPLLTQAKLFTSRSTFDSQTLPRGSVELGSGLGARYVVLVGLKGSLAEAQVWDTATSNRLRDLTFDSGDEAAVKKAAESIELWLSRPAPTLYVDASAQQSGEPVVKKWWFWTAVGVVAVGAGTAIAVVASNNSARGLNVVTGLPR